MRPGLWGRKLGDTCSPIVSIPVNFNFLRHVKFLGFAKTMRFKNDSNTKFVKSIQILQQKNVTNEERTW